MHQKKKRRKSSPKVVEAIPSPTPIWWGRRWLLTFVALGLTVFSVWTMRRSAPTPSLALATPISETPSLIELLAMKPEDLAQVDIAVMNLRCAEGLRGSEKLDLIVARRVLDGLASHVKLETERHLYRFNDRPEEYQNSEPYFRLLMLTVVLQEDANVRYNPARMSEPGDFEANATFFADSKDVFLNGLVGPPMTGTCASLPVLYVAVGRRLGYPLFLVTTKNHMFVRWEDAHNRLNMDATGHGFTSDSDEYYKTWPFKITEEEVARNSYLKSLTPTEELACFMSLRGACLYDGMGHFKEGIAAYCEALHLAPHIPAYRAITEMAVARLQARQARQITKLLDGADITNMAPPQKLHQGSVNR
jgi:hypothetical protein